VPEYGWVVDQKFVPIEGASYEIAFSKVLYCGTLRQMTRRVRTMGTTPETWIDIDTGTPLGLGLQDVIVHGFRRLD
jgi:hypothetical protein